MGDFRVQNFKVLVNKGDAETDVAIPLPVRTDRTRILKSSPQNQMQVQTSLTSPLLSTRDVQVGLELVDSITVRIHTSPNKKYDGVVVFSLMEYTGVTGGANEFLVSRRALFNPLGSNGVDLSIVGFSNTNAEKITTHIVGVILDNTVGSDSVGDYEVATLFYPMFRFVTDFETMESQQIWVGTSSHAAWVYVEQVEWRGSNWTVNHPPANLGTTGKADTIPFTVAGGTGTSGFLLNDLLWENTWIEQQRGVDLFTLPVNGETVSHIIPILPGVFETPAYTAFSPSGADTSNEPTNGAAFYSISNPEVKVQHQGFKLPDGGFDGLRGLDPSNPKTLQVPVGDDTTTIDAEPDRVFAILAGEPVSRGAGFTDGSVQFQGDDAVSFRRSNSLADWNEYIQIVQLGLEAGADGAIEDSVILQPDVSSTIRNK